MEVIITPTSKNCSIDKRIWDKELAIAATIIIPQQRRYNIILSVYDRYGNQEDSPAWEILYEERFNILSLQEWYVLCKAKTSVACRNG